MQKNENADRADQAGFQDDFYKIYPKNPPNPPDPRSKLIQIN